MGRPHPGPTQYSPLYNPTPPAPSRPPPERRLLESWVVKARRRGMGQHQIVTWVRRKVGAHVTVFRTLADGTLACAAPCLLCQRELLRFDLRVHCSLAPAQWWSGRLTDETAPPGKLTTRQRIMMPGPCDTHSSPPQQQAAGTSSCQQAAAANQQRQQQTPPKGGRGRRRQSQG